MFLHSDRFLLQTVRVFFLIFQIVLKVFLFPIWSVLPSFSTSETSVINLEKFVYEARIDGYNLIRSNPEKTKEWYIFEGYSKPDIYIETTSSIYIAEAKRTEPHLTTSTQWLDPRDQLIRHADSIIDGEKQVYYFFIIDEEKINSYELTRYEDLDYYEKNLPHRNKKEDFQKFRDSYCGYTTWTKISNILKIKFPDTINEL